MGSYWATGAALVIVAVLATRIRKLERLTLPRVAVSPLVYSALIFVTATVLASIIAVTVFGGSANTSDEIAQLWHAKILLSGHLALPADPNPEFFAIETVVDRGAWYSQFPIGAAVAAIPGALTGMPWLTNAVLAGASAVLLYRFVRLAYGEHHARLVAALFVVSPMVIFMAATWMNHVPVLFLAVLSLELLAEWNRAATARAAWMSAAGLGLAVGLMATIRPLDAVVVAAVIGVFQLWRCIGDGDRWKSLGVECVAGISAIAPLLYANKQTTGSATRFGYQVLWGDAHGMGFHVDPYGTPHTVSRGLDYMVTYLTELNVYLLAWPLPALAIVICALVLLWRAANRWDALMLGLFGAQLLAYAAYWYEGEFLGPRFLYTALPALLILVARALMLGVDRLGPRSRLPLATMVVAFVALAWCAPGLQLNALGFATQARAARSTLRQDIGHSVSDAGIHKAVVFIREPFTSRLTRRLWAVGFSRATSARLVGIANPCSLFIAARAVDRDSLRLAGDSVAIIMRAADSITQSRRPLRPGVVSDAATAACLAELDADQRIGTSSFGSALPLETIDAQGHLGGDVVYAADLGDRNDALKPRFGDRVWYRLQTGRDGAGRMVSTIRRY
jgi:hypothetical protein